LLIIRDNLYHQTVSDLIRLSKEDGWDGYYFDFRGQCSDHEFPADTQHFGQVLGSLLSLKTFKNCGDCHWRLHLKKKGYSSVYLKIRDSASGMTFKFKTDNFVGIHQMTLESVIAYMAFDKYYHGAYRSDFVEVEYTPVGTSMDRYSTVELLEEINRRNKEDLPDWSKRLTKGMDKQSELNKLCVA
jgi:hypothetical protein